MNGIPTTFAALVLAALLFVLGTLHRRDDRARKTIARLHDRNEELARELASLELLKTRLLSRVGEALSLPLQTASEAADKLRAQGADLPEEIRKSLSDLSGEIASITSILGMFEEMAARGDEDPVLDELPLVELDSVAIDSIQKVMDDASGNSISLAVSLDPGILVRGSAERLAEALDNLLREALRRVSRGSVISVTLTAEDRAACLTISYDNTNPGVKETILGTGMARLIVTSFGGWLNEDHERGMLCMSLPLAEGGKT